MTYSTYSCIAARTCVARTTDDMMCWRLEGDVQVAIKLLLRLWQSTPSTTNPPLQHLGSSVLSELQPPHDPSTDHRRYQQSSLQP